MIISVSPWIRRRRRGAWTLQEAVLPAWMKATMFFYGRVRLDHGVDELLPRLHGWKEGILGASVVAWMVPKSWRGKRSLGMTA